MSGSSGITQVAGITAVAAVSGGGGGGVASLNALTGALTITSHGGSISVSAGTNNIDLIANTGGAGTVTTISVVSANSFSGTIANATTTPAITIKVSALPATKIGTGAVDNTEFSYLDGVTSSIQTQFSGKQGNIQYQNQGIDVGSSGGISTINFAGGAVIASATGTVLTVRCSATGGGGTGTVESVTVVSANGFKGTVASATTTPKITLDVSALDAVKIGTGIVSNTEFGYLDGVTSSIQTQINGKQNSGNYITALTGDGAASGPGSASFTLATVNITTGTFGSAAVTPSFTVNGKGLITSASNVPISILASQISDSGANGRQILQAATTAAAQDALGMGAFGKAFIAVATTAAAQGMLEAGTVGLQIFKTSTTAAAQLVLGMGTFGQAFIAASTTAAAQSMLEAGTVGLQIFKTATTAAAQNALGGGAVGEALFATATTAAAQNILNISTFGATLTITADATAARNVLLAPGSVITGVSGAAAITNLVSLTSGNYASITPVSTTIYFITDAT